MQSRGVQIVCVKSVFHGRDSKFELGTNRGARSQAPRIINSGGTV